MEFAVSYKIKTFLGDEKEYAVRVYGGLNLERLLKKIDLYKDTSFGEIRIYDPETMQLPEWKDGDKNIYLYHENIDGSELNEIFYEEEHAEEELLIRFTIYAKQTFADYPETKDDSIIRKFLEDHVLEHVTVTNNEISFYGYGTKHCWKVSAIIPADS